MNDAPAILKVTFRVERTPSSKLRPNAVNSSRWGVQARRPHAALLRTSVREKVKSDLVAWRLDHRTPLFAGPCRVDVVVYWERYFAGKTARLQYRTDVESDALISMCKPLYDGLEDAEVVKSDQQFTMFHVEQHRDPNGTGYVLITVAPIEGKQE